ncbi:MAG TPA: hypothetical protein VH165_09320 [Kofleriaceae bacterium]|nr:hypothetical protein [Kofleriaceae bacterium]
MTRLSRLAILISLGAMTRPTSARADDLPPLSIYGFARLDAIADTAQMSDIAQARFVLPRDPTAHDDGELTLTPRLSRIGLGIDAWELTPGITSDGKVEVDFAGGSNMTTLRLRQAYASIHLEHAIELVAGQTADLISPLVPSVQNDTQLLYAGNTGDRRPQLQLSITPGDHVRIAGAVAAAGALSASDADHDGRIDGMANLQPMVQWLVEYRQRQAGDVLRFGVWGHVAQPEFASGMQYTSASGGLHLYLPLLTRLVALGEAYFGSDLADIGGGLDQSYNLTERRAIRGAGGWGELAAMPSDRHIVAIGATVDTARASDLPTGDPERNQTIYGVVRYKPVPALQFGVEYLSWRTRYKDAGDATASRVDLHLSVFF